jgi:serine/threonine-protein phosphatase 2A regulatory subunit B
MLKVQKTKETQLQTLTSILLTNKNHLVFEEPEDPSNRSFFSEIISSISDVKFSQDGRYILSRDYLTLKLWDINMENKPIRTINVHDNLRSKLCDLYENDCIFDKFECTFSGDGRYVLGILLTKKRGQLTYNLYIIAT